MGGSVFLTSNTYPFQSDQVSSTWINQLKSHLLLKWVAISVAIENKDFNDSQWSCNTHTFVCIYLRYCVSVLTGKIAIGRHKCRIKIVLISSINKIDKVKNNKKKGQWACGDRACRRRYIPFGMPSADWRTGRGVGGARAGGKRRSLVIAPPLVLPRRGGRDCGSGFTWTTESIMVAWWTLWVCNRVTV